MAYVANEQCIRLLHYYALSICITSGLLSPSALGQFIKHTDPGGNVIYQQDPSYDYSQDDPGDENRRINAEQLRRLREFIEYRQGLPQPEPRAPQVTIRTGRAVCRKRLSLLRPGIGCN